ncbi:MAG: hypothetical protein MUF58_03155 [Arcicella sp.]|nr:hypothetical protein [Arcicella sp.]
MKRKNIIVGCLLTISVGLTSCFEDLAIRYDKAGVVEFEDAVRRTPAAGAIFPIIAVNRTAGLQSLQVNLVGQQLKTSEEMTVSVDTTISSFLNATTIRAVEGTHFNLNGGKFTMKTDTSFARFQFNVQNVAPVAGRSALVVLKLDGGSNTKPTENYRRVGFRISLQ